MLSIDANRFWDVADSLGISSPSIVEKDYWAIQLLDEVSKFSLNGYQLVIIHTRRQAADSIPCMEAIDEQES